jgi:transposase
MQVEDFYGKILGIEPPWRIANVEFDKPAGIVHVQLEHEASIRWQCPCCDQQLPVYDHVAERQWRHLDTCQYETLLHARLPRVKCPEHGVKQVPVAWAEPGSRFTILFEAHAVEVITACEVVSAACRILRISWDQTWRVIERAVQRGKLRKQPRHSQRIGADEKAFAKGHSYMTIVCDIDHGTVEYVADGRTKESLAGFFQGLSAAQQQAIEAVAIDMHEPYVQAIKEELPLADDKIVHDRFHIMQHASEAVDKTRKQEHRQLSEEGDKRLAKSKYLWLKSQENLSDSQRERFEDLFSLSLKTAKAWGLKELLRELWQQPTVAEATAFFGHWYRSVIHGMIEPMKKVARMIKTRLGQVVSYCRHRITNAVAEGLNSKIMSIKRRARGFRNPEHFKVAIFFYCGGLDLHPRPH